MAEPAVAMGHAVTVDVESGEMRFSFVAVGMSASIQGHAVVVEPQIARFFALVERALDANVAIANRNIDLQQQALQIQALNGATGAKH